MTVVLWDLDGTLQDSEALSHQCIRYAFQDVLNREPTAEELGALLGRPIRLQYLEWFEAETVARLLAVGHAYYQAQRAAIVCYPGVVETLISLHQAGVRMGVVTSKTGDAAREEIEANGLASLFEVVVVQEDTVRHKPHAEPLLVAARLLGCEASHCVYIGDQPTDMMAAHAAGMIGIGALWGEGTKERLLLGEPQYVAETPADVEPIVHQLARNRQTSF